MCPPGPARRARLRGPGEVRGTLARGRRSVADRVVLYVVPADQATRVAFVCGRRVGNAVARNRARRLMREAWRALASEIPGGFDIVFVARTDIDGAGMDEVMADMRIALARAGVTGR